MIPTVELEVIGSKKREKITALIDTGFTGWLCLPTKTAQRLGLERSGEEESELGDGQWVKQLEFSGKVHFLGKTQDVTIVLTNSETAQVGILLMADCRLTVDFPTNQVQLKRKKL